MPFQKGHTINKGKKRPGIGGVKKGNIPWNKGLKGFNAGIKRSAETKKRMSEAMKSIKMIPPSQKGIKRSPEYIEAMRKRLTGENNSRWKGGITNGNDKIRQSFEYRKWRIAVYQRDYYTCQGCEKVGGKLNAHHIKSFAHYQELRFDINNGVTLCEDCHQLTDNFAGKNKKKI